MGDNHTHSHKGHEDHHHHNGDGHHHSHVPEVNESNLKRVGWAAALTGLFMIAEVAGGLLSGSLALLADAGHMLTDFAALLMAWIAFLIARRPSTWKHTFGFDRFSVLVAFINGLLLFVVAALIIKESIERVQEPQPILAGPMLWVAIGGLVVNIVVFKILQGADQHNLNIRGAALHVLGDLLGSVAAIIAALTIMATGWMPIDPILSVLVSVIILKSALSLVKDSAHILLEGAPHHIDRRVIAEELVSNIDDLNAIEHVHVWSITAQRHMLTLDAFIRPEAAIEPISVAIRHYLATEFQVDHVTVNVMRRD